MPNILLMSVVHLITIVAVTTIVAALHISTEAKALPTAAYAAQRLTRLTATRQDV